MRNPRFAKLPKTSVMHWVVWNKLKATFGVPISFDRYIDYGEVQHDANPVKRVSFLEQNEKRQVQPAKSRRYKQFDGFFNR